MTGIESGLVRTVRSSFDAALGILNSETVALAKQGFLLWEADTNAARGPAAPQVKVHFAVLTFDRIAGEAERKRFNALPTTFRLEVDEVDALIGEAARLLRQSGEYQEFLRQLDVVPQ